MTDKERKTLVLASGNKGKIAEIGEMLPEFSVIGYKDAGLDFEIEETGATFYENALIKAKAVSEALGLPALADDSGLCVDALNGEPGVYSARYSGNGSVANMNKLLEKMKGITDRRAKFVSSVVLYTKDKVYEGVGETFGEILTEKRGDKGFGYDPIFYSYDLKKSFGEATDEEKNSVSHRARALENLNERIGNIL